MKKLTMFMAAVMLVILMASCEKVDYTNFIGTWGVERIDYYNSDFWGDPIWSTMKTYEFTPGDMEGGIDLVFREDKTGEMRDRSRDTLYVPVFENDTIVDTLTLICPDTTLVTKFTFSYNTDDKLLFMNMQVEHPYIYQMKVRFSDENTFVYENEYDNNYVEKARLVRYSTETRGAARGSKSSQIPPHPKSLFSNY